MQEFFSDHEIINKMRKHDLNLCKKVLSCSWRLVSSPVSMLVMNQQLHTWNYRLVCF
jgi:hypothetical protein